MKTSIRDCIIKDIPVIQDLAEKTWWAAYASILSKEQIRYMLDTIYSIEALEQGMRSDSQHFIFLLEDDQPVGFASYGKRPENSSIFKLHKIYVLPQIHGKGYGRLLINEVLNRLQQINIHMLDLNVNRYNPAKTFYEKLGFKIIKEEDIPIGPYWMNDYVMRLEF